VIECFSMIEYDSSEWHLHVDQLTQKEALEAAISLAQTRGFACFPLHSYDFEAMSCTCYNPDCTVPAKHPACPHGHLDATTNADELRALFTETQSTYLNVGVSCGRVSGGIVVIDIDPRNGGWDSLGELEYIAEVQGVSLSTLSSSSGGGGAHLWYKLPSDLIVPKKTGIKAGIDLQGEGAYVVAPPSLHASAQRYVWGEDRQIVLLPPMFVEVAKERTRVEATAGGFTLPTGETLSDVLAGRARIPAGSRDEAFTSLAARFRFQGLSRDDASKLIIEVLENGTEQPDGNLFSEKQVLGKIDSAWRRLTPEPTEEGLEEAAETFLEALERQKAIEIEALPPVEFDDHDLLDGWTLAVDTDNANAQRLARRYRNRLFYFHDDRTKWWTCLEPDAIWRRAPNAAEKLGAVLESLIRLEALHAPHDEEDRDRLLALAHKCGSASTLAAAARRLSVHGDIDKGTQMPVDIFDRNPLLLAFQNGVYDLSANVFRAVTPEDLISRTTAYPYVPAATCPRFRKFIARVLPDDEVRACMLRLLGQSLLGADKEHYMPILTGAGANGKSTLLTVIRKVLGAYAGDVPTTVFVSRNGREAPFDLVRLEGIRFGMNTVEVEQDQRLNDGVLKAIISLDTLEARNLYEGFRSVPVQATLFMSANNMPHLTDTSYGMARRLLCFNFKVTIPEQERNTNMVEELLEEGPGILQLLVEECRRYREEGIVIPEEVAEWTSDYITSENPFLRFEARYLEQSVTEWVSFNALYALYLQWCDTEGEESQTKNAFARTLSKYPSKNTMIDGRVQRARRAKVIDKGA
jgi:putative DNA primase/helicase